jgi:predicted DNA-binding transcriptional regulator AlpA
MPKKEVAVHRRNMRTAHAAVYLGIAGSTLAKMRMRGDRPVFSKAGPRVVVYDVADLDDWLEGRKRRSTSDLGEADRA